MADLIINSSITHSALLVLPLVLAVLLRWARVPGWPVLGGLAAGLVLGPTIFGRVAPETFEARFVGGVEERQALDALVRQHDADRLAAETLGMDRRDLLELVQSHHEPERQLEAELHEARWSFQRPFRSYTAAVVVLALAGTILVRQPRGDDRTDPLSVSSIGLWSAALPGGIAMAASVWWWRHDIAAALAAASALSIGPWVLNASDRAAANDAEVGGGRRLELAGRVATIAALLAASFALALHLGWPDALWGAPLATILIGWIALPFTERQRKISRAVLDYTVLPSLAACVALRVDAIAQFAIASVILFALLSADGRWFGAFLGAMLPGGRRGLRTMRLVLGSMDAGPTQLAVAAVMVHTGVIDGTTALALIVGAVVIEVTAPARRIAAEQLVVAEAELEE